jgi:hypothetical protein
MGKKINVTGKPARRIEVSGKPQRRIEPEESAAALGAEPVEILTVKSRVRKNRAADALKNTVGYRHP